MPAHYAYSDPDKTTLRQGDILRKTDELVSHLRKYHAHYADHPDYKYFMVLTQSCDLVRRKGKPCNSQYITIAAVRPVEEALLREAAKRQEDWQQQARVISSRDRDTLANFIKSLLDNNKERYFYIHTDIKMGIQQNCCVFLQLAVSLKAEHYEMCLAAKKLSENRWNTFCTKELVASNTISVHDNRSLSHGPPETSTPTAGYDLGSPR